ncbi:MAG TPA: biotin transporter BioY [Candidatus Angelobacter sp.]|nr:biotin transporter BioY [Candidatus Angelobacter sp.]
MTTNVLGSRPRVLADLVPGGAVRDLALIAGAAALTGLAAQVAVPLPFTPVPLSLQTFTVLLAAAALGPYRAGSAMLLYLAAGMAGVPWFAEQRSGIGFPSFGYLVGFVLAAVVVGALARRGADRSLSGAAGTMVLGNLVIYAIGVPYLAFAIGADLPTAMALGLTPFLLGDALKILLATGLLPATWRLVGRRS